ncbi:MAG: glycosyltransferase family 4 protein, partial [Candidatus Dormibacteria bacterium]
LSAQTTAMLRRSGIHRVHHIPPGVDLDRCSPAPFSAGYAQLDAGDGPFLLFAGHHDERGGLEAALDVLARIRRGRPDVRLLTAMRHRPGEDRQALRRRLHALADDRGVRGAVVELGAMANMRAAILASHAVLFQPARLGLKMDLPLTLVEALAFGRPVIVSPVETLPEMGEEPAVIAGRPHDGRVLDHLCALLEDSALFDRASRAARATAVERYDARQMVARYNDLYREAAASRSAVPA